ncbi:hypothetical protein ABK040_015810 [Willaertia magna]
MCEKLYLNDAYLFEYSDDIFIENISIIYQSSNLNVNNNETTQNEQQQLKLVQQLQKKYSFKTLYSITTNKTIFHGQGGGQPSDEGFFKINKIFNFQVIFVKINENSITEHFGYFVEEKELNNENGKNMIEKVMDDNNIWKDLIGCKDVLQKVNKEKRILFTKIHSAAHLMDLAVIESGCDLWKPSRGYHFEDSPYVEYFHNNQLNISLDQLTNILNKKIKELLEIYGNDPNLIQKFIIYKKENNFEDISSLGLQMKIPENLKSQPMIRIVKYGKYECFCSGTHVNLISEIGEFLVTKCKKSKDTVRISYKLKGI